MQLRFEQSIKNGYANCPSPVPSVRQVGEGWGSVGGGGANSLKTLIKKKKAKQCACLCMFLKSYSTRASLPPMKLLLSNFISLSLPWPQRPQPAGCRTTCIKLLAWRSGKPTLIIPALMKLLRTTAQSLKEGKNTSFGSNVAGWGASSAERETELK